MEKEFSKWFSEYYRINWVVGPDTYSREEAQEIASAAWKAAQQSVQRTDPLACDFCGHVDGSHDLSLHPQSG